MKNRNLLIPMLSIVAPLLSITSALAYDTECATFSRGLLFRTSHYNPGYAQNVALNNCKSSGSTSNSECDSNLVCTDRPAPMDRCSTFSRGLLFESSSDVRGFAQHQAIARCKASGSTSNTECDSNVRCDLDPSGPVDPYPPMPTDPYPPRPTDPYPPGPGPSYPPSSGQVRATELVGQWRASNCNYCFLQVSLHRGQLYGDMTPWDTNRSYSGGLQPIVLLAKNMIEYRGDIFRVDRVGSRSSLGLSMVNISRRSTSRNVQTAELESYRPAPGPIPPRPRAVSCTIHKNGRIYRASGTTRGKAMASILAQCAADARGYVCRSSEAVCTQ
jgi:hypothetical protein